MIDNHTVITAIPNDLGPGHLPRGRQLTHNVCYIDPYVSTLKTLTSALAAENRRDMSLLKPREVEKEQF